MLGSAAYDGIAGADRAASSGETTGLEGCADGIGLKKLEAIFRHKVFRMLLKKGKISEEMVRMLSAWKHSGFNVFCGNRPSTSSGKA